jgi:hypothetical protein
MEKKKIFFFWKKYEKDIFFNSFFNKNLQKVAQGGVTEKRTLPDNRE